jgi:hypothetical protein
VPVSMESNRSGVRVTSLLAITCMLQIVVIVISFPKEHVLNYGVCLRCCRTSTFLIVDFHTKFHNRNSSGALVTAVKLKSK